MIPERALDGMEMPAAGEQDTKRRLIPFSVRGNRILLAAALSVLVLLSAGMVWSQTGMGDRFAAPEPETQVASLTIETPTPMQEKETEPTPTATVKGEETVEAAKPTATATLVLEAEVATTEAISRTKQVAMRGLSSQEASAAEEGEAPVEASSEEGPAEDSPEVEASEAMDPEAEAPQEEAPDQEPDESLIEAGSEDGELPSTGISLWLPIQGVSVMALLFFWREMRWRRTGR
jgi:hypothetical protein